MVGEKWLGHAHCSEHFGIREGALRAIIAAGVQSPTRARGGELAVPHACLDFLRCALL